MACKTKKHGEGVLECKVWRRCNLSVPFTTYVRSNTFLGNKKVFRFNFGGFGAAATKPKNGEKIGKNRKNQKKMGHRIVKRKAHFEVFGALRGNNRNY